MSLRSIAVFLLLFISPTLRAQFPVSGVLTDAGDGKALPNVSIENVHTQLGTTSDSAGQFSLTVNKGQLVEFRKLGYKTTRVRIPEGAVPPFFRIMMEKGAIELQEVLVRDRFRDYKTDSLRYRELYKRQLDFPELTGLQAIQHPFSALSKKNRQIWAFQKEYSAFEQMKYVDYTFNERLIKSLTDLSGDSVNRYRMAYKPSYIMLRNMSEYDFYNYIKRTVARFRRYGR